MEQSMSSESVELPAFLREKSILVPMKLDITYNGARIVDSFCWNLYCPYLTPDEFAFTTCADLNLPYGFQVQIKQQISEQIASYMEIISTIKKYAKYIPQWSIKIRDLIPITLGIRHNTIDYSDKINWNPMCEYLTPEIFASTTCRDLGLPHDIRPAISHRIRESLFRWIIAILNDPDNKETYNTAEFKISDSKIAHVSLAQTPQAVDMASSLWKRAKPGTVEETAVVPQPLLPTERDTNANIWIKRQDKTEILGNSSATQCKAE